MDIYIQVCSQLSKTIDYLLAKSMVSSYFSSEVSCPQTAFHVKTHEESIYMRFNATSPINLFLLYVLSTNVNMHISFELSHALCR